MIREENKLLTYQFIKPILNITNLQNSVLYIKQFNTKKTETMKLTVSILLCFNDKVYIYFPIILALSCFEIDSYTKFNIN